jgi:hypothetical protein
MRTIALLRWALLVPMMLVLPTVSSAQATVSITIGPPALPEYQQPVAPDAGYLWTPGYWDYGSDGYYWVPGTWVLVPEPGLLWTPGYWGWGDGGYVWNRGYWGSEVGYYGGINYGYGYGGDGYQGGYWNGGRLYYNRSVNNISTTTNITNVYTKTVVNNTTTTNVSYNGGPGGTTARPTAAEVAAGRQPHTPPTAAQTQHAQAASTNRAQLASVNHGQPAIVATAKPGVFTGQGVVTASRAPVQYRAVSNGTVAKPAESRPATPAQPKAVAAPPSRPSAPPPAKATPAPVRQPENQPKTKPESAPKPQGQPKPPEDKPKSEAPPT